MTSNKFILFLIFEVIIVLFIAFIVVLLSNNTTKIDSSYNDEIENNNRIINLYQDSILKLDAKLDLLQIKIDSLYIDIVNRDTIIQYIKINTNETRNIVSNFTTAEHIEFFTKFVSPRDTI